MIPNVLNKVFNWNFPLAIFFLNYIDHLFYALTNLKFFPIRSKIGIINFSIGIFNLLILFIIVNFIRRILFLVYFIDKPDQYNILYQNYVKTIENLSKIKTT